MTAGVSTGRTQPRVRRGYALGGVATGSFGTVPGLLLLPYLTDVLGIAAVLASAIVFLPKAWDVVANPVVGRISDRNRHRWGRRPWLLGGGIALALGFLAMFLGPVAPPWAAGLWVAVLFALTATAYAAFQVPYVALPAEITDDYDERTRLLSTRVVVLALAILLSGATAPILVQALPGVGGYRLMAGYVALLILAGAVAAWWGVRSVAGPAGEPTEPAGLGPELRAVLGSPFGRLLGSFVVQAVAIGVLLAGVAYTAKDLLGSPAVATFLFVAFVGPALLVTPLWERWSRGVRSKRSGWWLASLTMVLGAGLMTLAFPIQPLVLVAAAMVGIGYSGMQVFPLAMLPDAAAADEASLGRNRNGVFTGVWTAGETLGMALGPGIFALVLAVGGYRSSVAGIAVDQPDSALLAIRLGASLLPALLVLASLVLLRGYAEPIGQDRRIGQERRTGGTTDA